jgi:hypothetical protein
LMNSRAKTLAVILPLNTDSLYDLLASFSKEAKQSETDKSDCLNKYSC